METPEKQRKAEIATIKIVPKSIVSYNVVNQIDKSKLRDGLREQIKIIDVNMSIQPSVTHQVVTTKLINRRSSFFKNEEKLINTAYSKGIG
jgi:hypothetical protein